MERNVNKGLVERELTKHRTGVRGWRICIMVTFLCIPAFLCLANLVLMISLFTVLDVTYHGMASMSFFKNPKYTKWHLDADFENIVIKDSIIRGFSDRNIEVIGEEQSIDFSAEKLLKTSISVTPNGTIIKAEEVKFVNPDTKKTILDFTSGGHVPVFGEFNGNHMVANIIQTPRVVSPMKESLHISSNNSIEVTGNEGAYADSKSIHVRAKKDVVLRVRDNKYVLALDGRGGGVKVEPSKLPVVASGDNVDGTEKYRLCVCIKSGVLFRARVTSSKITCAVATERPC